MMPMLAFFGIDDVIVAAWWVFTAVVAPTAIAYSIAYLLRSKGSSGDSGTLDTTRFPTVEEGRAYPVIFGTPRIDGYDAPWVANVRTDDHHRSDVVVYTVYSSDAHLIYCQGPIDGFKQFWYGDSAGGKCAWPTANDPTVYAADGETEISFPSAAWFLYGGPYSGGGILGNMDALLGSWTQPRNAYLVSKLGADVPAYRGLASLVCKQLFWGVSPYPQILAALVKRVLVEGRGEERWYVAKAPIGGDGLDLNACHMVRECLTNQDWGDAMATADLGDTWEPVADVCYTEGLGLSASYSPEPGNLKTFIAEVLEVMDAVLYDDPTTGKIEIKLLRDDYDVDDLPLFTERDFKIVSHVKPHWRDAIGRTLVQYTDRQHPTNDVPASYEDLAIIAKQGGRIVEKTLEYPMICDFDLANDVAARKGRSATALLSVMTLECKGIMAGLHKGQPFRLSYDIPGLSITSMVVRVSEMEVAGSDDASFTMDVMEDVYKTAYTIRTAATSQWTDSTPGQDVTIIDSLEIAAEEAVFNIINETEA